MSPPDDIPTDVLHLMDRPDILAAIRHADEHPEELVRRELRPAPDVDWENPD